MKYPENRATVKLGSQPTGYSSFKYDEVTKEKLLLMGVTHPKYLPSFHLLLLLPLINNQVSKNESFPVWKPKRNHC